MPLATFLSCMHFSYELLDFIGMATRESRHAIFVSYRLLNFLKTCASIGNLLKESSYPYSRHGNTIYTNNFENFVQNIWLCKKFFVPLQRTKRTRVNLCSFRFVSIKQDYGMATRERRLCLVLIKDETGKKKL